MTDPLTEDTVVPFRRNYGTKENPCAVPPPIGPQDSGVPAPDGTWPEGAEPLQDGWEPI